MYSCGNRYCFVCHTFTGGDGSTVVHNRIMSTYFYKGQAHPLKKRDISEKTCEKFKIYHDGDKLRFHYHDSEGRVIGSKIRTADKQFSYEGETDGSFFGQQLWKGHGKQIVITEGDYE